MEDRQIVDLFCQRAERAIAETEKKYGRYCRSIARNICSTDEDAEECVSDAYFRAWNLMPDKRPAVLSAFLGCLVRSCALDRLRLNRRRKRGGGETQLALEELEECIPDGTDVERSVELRELERAVGRFVSALEGAEKRAFVLRYWHVCGVAEIAERLQLKENTVKSILFRCRKKLRNFLQEEGLC